MTGLRPFRLIPAYHERVWGGHRLKRCSPPVGEAWLVEAHNAIADGPFAGLALADLAGRERDRLLGTDGAAACRNGFPLIIKLLDTAEWISVQVHPDDCLAEALEGPGATGKTEAWYVIDARPGAGIVTGVMPGASIPLLAAIDDPARALEHLAFRHVGPGDTALVEAGTVHSLGPGLLVYEVQQASHLTYRAYDWGRDASVRDIDLERFSLAADPARRACILPADDGPGLRLLAGCAYFRLEQATGDAGIHLETAGRTFHAVTAINGAVTIEGHRWAERLDVLDTVVVPAGAGAYCLRTDPGGRALIASVPPSSS
ncbi:MAG: class I mannose-6-phosphate isomerase [Dehalococcoidia bacterium]